MSVGKVDPTLLVRYLRDMRIEVREPSDGEIDRDTEYHLVLVYRNTADQGLISSLDAMLACAEDLHHMLDDEALAMWLEMNGLNDLCSALPNPATIIPEKVRRYNERITDNTIEAEYGTRAGPYTGR